MDWEQILNLDFIQAGLPASEREYTFAPPRRWRFDFAWPQHKLAVEIEGGSWTLGRHTRGEGFRNDCEKYNEAVLLGWSVLRFTPDMIESGYAVKTVRKWFSVCKAYLSQQ